MVELMDFLYQRTNTLKEIGKSNFRNKCFVPKTYKYVFYMIYNIIAIYLLLINNE